MSPLTLKLESRWAKSNPSIASSQWCIHVSFKRIHSSIHKIGCTQAFLVQICYSTVSCDLENMVKVTKIQQLNCPIPIMYPCEFDKNPLIGSFSGAQTTGYTNANAEPTDPHQKQYVPLPLCFGTYKTKTMTLTPLTVVKKDTKDYFFRSKFNSVTNKKFLVQTTCVVYAIKIVT